MTTNPNTWIYEKCLELSNELQKLSWLMAGCQIGIHESINPIMNYKKTIEKSKGKKRDLARALIQVLIRNGVDSRYIVMNEVANFLRSETSADFQFMYRIWTIMLWSILENYVRDFLVEWIKRNPQIMRAEALQKIQISLGEYELLQGDEKYEYIVEMVERQSKAGLGIGQFEVLLEQVELSGKVDNKIKRNLLELQQVRHVLAHRNGIVDRRLIKRCPWITSNIGETIHIDADRFGDYYNAVLTYAVGIGDRATRRTSKSSE